MKKYFKFLIILLLILIIVLLIILFINYRNRIYDTRHITNYDYNNVDNNDDVNSYDSNDYDLNGKNIINISGYMEKAFKDDFKELATHADYIVKGIVKSVDFTSFNGVAWTKVNLLLNDIYKGDLNNRVSISYYFYGGYVSMEEYLKYNDDYDKFGNPSDEEIKNTIIKQYSDNETEFVQKGDEIIVLLVKTREWSPLENDALERLFPSGMLVKEGNVFKQKYGEVESYYSINENNLNNFKQELDIE